MTTRILTLSLGVLLAANAASAVPAAIGRQAADTPAFQSAPPKTPPQATPPPKTTPPQTTPKTPTTQATPPTQAPPPTKGTTPPQATPPKGTAAGKAPPAKKKPPRMKFVHVDVGAQYNPSTVSPTLTYKVYGEDATIDATYDTGVVLAFGARGGINIRKRMLVGVGVGLFTSTQDLAVKGQLPHPFFFQKPRTVEGTAPGVQRNEFALYAEVGWLKTLSKTLDVMLFGGPAAFYVEQSVVTRIQADDRYPFDTAGFSGAELTNVSAWAPGLTVGADFSYRIGKKFRVGGLVRYSYGSTKVEPIEGQTFSLPLGGLQASGGIRVRF